MSDPHTAAEHACGLLLGGPSRLGGVRLGVVDGPSGSGKSSFAQLWVDALGRAGCRSVCLFSSDLLATWAEPFGWFERLDNGVLVPLAKGRPGRIRVTDWAGGEPSPGSWVDVPVVDALILEGVSCGRVTMGARISTLVWMRLADRTERLERAVARDGESSRTFLAAWQDDEDAFFERDRTASRADVVVDVDPTA